MEVEDILILIAAGFFAGFANVVAGGGSLISLPILIFLGLPASVANATNRIGLIIQNITAVAGFRSKGVSAFPYSMYLSISALLGAILGARLSIEIPDQLFNRLIAIIMIAVLIVTIFNPAKKGHHEERLDRKSMIIGIIAFFGIGVYGGFIQVGVGFIVIAALTHINRFSLVKTNSAKVFVALVYLSASLGVFILEGMVNWSYGLILAIGSALGGWIASRWSVKKGDKWIKRILIIMAVAMAIRLWFY